MTTKLEDYRDAPEIEGQVIFENDWYLLDIPRDFYEDIISEVKGQGIKFRPNKNPHVSIMKKESPSKNKEDWGQKFVGEKVTVKYHTEVYDYNGYHLWVTCYSKRLCEMRDHFGLPTLRDVDNTFLVNFHLTLGRRNKPVAKNDPPYRRLCPQSSIDVNTGMQLL